MVANESKPAGDVPGSGDETAPRREPDSMTRPGPAGAEAHGTEEAGVEAPGSRASGAKRVGTPASGSDTPHSGATGKDAIGKSKPGKSKPGKSKPSKSKSGKPMSAKDVEAAEARQRRGDWRMFRTVIALVGLLVMAAGVYYVIAGTRGLPGPQGVEDPTIESNYRYFASLMVGIGGAFVAIAIKFEWANVLWFVCAMLFIGGIGRVVSWALVGTPHVLLIVLMILELAIPPVLVVWHRWVMKTQQLKISYGSRPPAQR